MKKRRVRVPKATFGVFIKSIFKKGIPLYVKTPMILALVYTVFPIDFLPDLLGPLGFADDAAIFALLSKIGMSLLDRYNQQEVIEDYEKKT